MEMYRFIYETLSKYYLTKEDYLNYDFDRDGPLIVYNFDSNFEEYSIWDRESNVSTTYDDLFSSNIVSCLGVGKNPWNWVLDWKDVDTVEHPIHGLYRKRNGKILWEDMKSDEQWNNFPMDGKIGWRGPMVKVDLLKELELPEVYWENHESNVVTFNEGKMEDYPVVEYDTANKSIEDYGPCGIETCM
jgi:hypothetical protein